MAKKETVFSTPWFDIESEEYDFPYLEGKPIYRINSPDSVLIFALTESGEIIFVRQFRPINNEVTIELPAGAIDENEDAKKAAERELFEETGYVCESMLCAATVRSSASRINNRVHVFYGLNARKDYGHKPEDGVEVITMKLHEFRDKVLSGEFRQIAGIGCLLLIFWKFRPKELAKIFDAQE